MRPAAPGSRLRLAALALVVVLAAVGCGSNNKNGGYTVNPGNGLELDSGDIQPGGNFQHRFAAAGTFPYHCIHHAPMTGSVVVSNSAADTVVTVGITSSTQPFPAASVKPGGRVVWTNNTGMLHTVTSN